MLVRGPEQGNHTAFKGKSSSSTFYGVLCNPAGYSLASLRRCLKDNKVIFKSIFIVDDANSYRVCNDWLLKKATVKIRWVER